MCAVCYMLSMSATVLVSRDTGHTQQLTSQQREQSTALTAGSQSPLSQLELPGTECCENGYDEQVCAPQPGRLGAGAGIRQVQVPRRV